MRKVVELFCVKPGQENNVQIFFSKYEAPNMKVLSKIATQFFLMFQWQGRPPPCGGPSDKVRKCCMGDSEFRF